MSKAFDPVELALARMTAEPGRAGGAQRLAAMLDESHAIYRGMSAADSEFVRGSVYAALARCGERGVEVARRQALEDLATSQSPHVLAGAARMLAADRPGLGRLAELAAAARRRIGNRDIYPDLLGQVVSPCCGPRRTALEELAVLETPGGSAGAASAGDAPEPLAAAVFTTLAEVRFEDQGGRVCAGQDLLGGPSRAVLAPFYTRCGNPLRCSLTVTRLGAAARTGAEPLRWYGLSYDPRFDNPVRLSDYGADRGFPFGPAARLLRCTHGWPALRKALDLRVGYGESTVNAHARELFLFGADAAWRLPADWLAEPERIEEFAEPAEARC